MPLAIEIKSLSKTFEDHQAVKDVSFSVSEREIYGLLGPNGAGKTTIIHSLLGLVTPTSGSVKVLGLELDKDRLQILSRVNFSSAYTALPANLSVYENLYIFAKLYGVKNPKARIDDLATLLDISEILPRLVGLLSSGQKTRLNLCKALLNEPELLLLDEPTASLDPEIAERVREILLALRKERGITILYTSHNMDEVQRICDRVAFLSRGKIVVEGTPKQILEHSQRRSLEDVFITIARNGELRDSAEKPS